MRINDPTVGIPRINHNYIVEEGTCRVENASAKELRIVSLMC